MIRFSGITKKFQYQKNFFSPRRYLYALKNIDLEIFRNLTTGIVGESGSGKSTLARILTGLYHPDKGYFAYNHYISAYLNTEKWKELRRRISMVFQDPYSSLNPRLTVKRIVEEPLIIHKNSISITKAEQLDLLEEIIQLVGLDVKDLEKLPSEFSGGQRQRIGIARSLILRPETIILDEPVSALDVSIQAQILNLLMDLKNQFSLTYLFIAHDLGVIRYISDYIVVMYLGQIMEVRKTESLFEHPFHPYTQSLIDSIPDIYSFKKPFYSLKGEIPSPFEDIRGCPFYSRCERKKTICKEEFPQKTKTGVNEYYFCHNPL